MTKLSPAKLDCLIRSIEIDPELNRLALAEAAKLYPEFADRASHIVVQPLAQGFDWRLMEVGIPAKLNVNPG